MFRIPKTALSSHDWNNIHCRSDFLLFNVQKGFRFAFALKWMWLSCCNDMHVAGVVINLGPLTTSLNTQHDTRWLRINKVSIVSAQYAIHSLSESPITIQTHASKRLLFANGLSRLICHFLGHSLRDYGLCCNTGPSQPLLSQLRSLLYMPGSIDSRGTNRSVSVRFCYDLLFECKKSFTNQEKWQGKHVGYSQSSHAGINVN